MQDETGLDWIEVRDRESGDTWFYNKRTGVSQWEKPDELDGQLSKSANVKRLPPFSSAAARQGTTHTTHTTHPHHLLSSAVMHLGRPTLSQIPNIWPSTYS